MPTVRQASVALLWHMHQPWYGDPRSGRMILPWTRLHALKDYLDMIAVAERHPEVHITFNLVPSLLLQLQLYATGQTTDDFRELAGRAPADLDHTARRRLLEDAFKCHWERMVEPYPRFRELLAKRGRNLATAGIEAAVQRFSEQDWRDLQVYSHLAWCGHELRHHEPVVAGLLRQGKHFTEAQKQELLVRLDAVVGAVLPRYIAAAREGHVELSTTPMYHPILPLLCHWPDVRAAMPGCRIPPGVEDLPQDAAAQLRRGRELFEQTIGFAPAGVWPSEGSVSGPAMELIAECGYQWAATDERILDRSLRKIAAPSSAGAREPQAADFFRAHRHAGVDLFFRHHRASDRIGFDYATWGADSAVRDFLHLLERSATSAAIERPVVPVILDGENCWEYYEDNGFPFLDRLYRSLHHHPWLEPVTFSEHRAMMPEPPALEWLFPGSWIGADFYIWAGHREDQRAWELLYAARRALVAGQEQLTDDVRAQAWEHLYIAQGSDWYWWYGDDHSSADDQAFDHLFRSHLQRIYELLGEAVPANLEEPISGLAPPLPLTPPVVPFTPILDGAETDFFEWRAAGVLHGEGPSGAMSRTDGQPGGLHRVRYGFDESQLYLAVELRPHDGGDGEQLELSWSAHGQVVRLLIEHPRRPRRESVAVAGNPSPAAAEVAAGRLLEIAVPRAALPAAAGEHTELTVELRRAGQSVDRWPQRGAFEFPLPDEREWLRHWLV